MGRFEFRIQMVGGAKETRQRQIVFLPYMYHQFLLKRPNTSQAIHLTSVYRQTKDPLVAT